MWVYNCLRSSGNSGWRQFWLLRSLGTGRLAEKQQARRVGGWSGSGECGFLSGIVGRRGNAQSVVEIISR